MSNAIAKPEQAGAIKPADPVHAALVKQMKAIDAALPKGYDVRRFCSTVMLTVLKNPMLRRCFQDSPTEFLNAVREAASLGVSFNESMGQAWLVPFNMRQSDGRDKWTAQLIIGYKGLLDLIYRTGRVSHVEAHVVRQGDKFDYCLGLEPKLEHKPAMVNRGDVVAAYAVIRFKDGHKTFTVMNREELEQHRARSKARHGPWVTDPEAMMLKTVLRQAVKYLEMTPEVRKAVYYADMEETEQPHTLDVEYETVLDRDSAQEQLDQMTEMLKEDSNGSDKRNRSKNQASTQPTAT